jgi:hypothetical protein
MTGGIGLTVLICICPNTNPYQALADISQDESLSPRPN